MSLCYLGRLGIRRIGGVREETEGIGRDTPYNKTLEHTYITDDRNQLYFWAPKLATTSRLIPVSFVLNYLGLFSLLHYYRIFCLVQILIIIEFRNPITAKFRNPDSNLKAAAAYYHSRYHHKKHL